MSASFAEQVASRASTLKPVRMALSVVAAPFYLLGLIVGVLWLVTSWVIAAAQIGFSDARLKATASRSRLET